MSSNTLNKSTRELIPFAGTSQTDINEIKTKLISTESYAECSTARSTAAKVVSLPGFVLTTGAHIRVRFTNTGSSNPSSGNLTLKVGDSDAKTIVNGHSNKTVMTYSNAGYFYNNQVAEFVYDGTYWVYLNSDNNTTYTGATLKTSAAKTGSAQSDITNTIAASTTMDNAIGTLLNNDATLKSSLAEKINTSDIANNLTTTASGKVLDARQGKALYDSLAITPFVKERATGGTNFHVVGTHGDQIWLVLGIYGVNQDMMGISIMFKQSSSTNVGGVRHFGATLFTASFDPTSFVITLHDLPSQYLKLVFYSNYDFNVSD